MSRAAKGLSIVLVSAAAGFFVGRVTAPAAERPTPEAPDLERVQLRERVLALEAHRDDLQRGLLEAQKRLQGETSTTGPKDRAAFVSPEINGRALDACIAEGQCGQAAADYFCRSNGYARASDFALVRGAFGTSSLVDGQIRCEPGSSPCSAFDLIVCERAP